MTQDRMQLSELLEKAGADEFVREMIGFAYGALLVVALSRWFVRANIGGPRWRALPRRHANG